MGVDDVYGAIGTVLPEPHAGLLSGIVFGTKAVMSPSLVDDLIATGTIHIVALSGANISILGALAGTVLVPLVGRRVASLLTVGILIGFVLFVGASPTVVRAALMGSISLFGVVAGRKPWPLWSLMVACVVMLATGLATIDDVSFQLSALATLGLILYGAPKTPSLLRVSHEDPPIRRAIRQAGLAVYRDLRLTLAAQVFTIPVILFRFHRLSFIAPVANIAIGWTLAPLTVLGLVIGAVALVVPVAAYPLGWVAWSLLTYLMGAVGLFASLPFSSVGW